MEAFYIKTGKYFSEKESLLCWQIIIPWLVERAKSYRVVCNPNKKGASEIISMLTEHADSREEKERSV
ncbi:MAG: hypothetical protein R8K20_00515, partial [Gallionellaceae bacterium]